MFPFDVKPEFIHEKSDVITTFTLIADKNVKLALMFSNDIVHSLKAYMLEY